MNNTIENLKNKIKPGALATALVVVGQACCCVAFVGYSILNSSFLKTIRGVGQEPTPTLSDLQIAEQDLDNVIATATTQKKLDAIETKKAEILNPATATTIPTATVSPIPSIKPKPTSTQIETPTPAKSYENPLSYKHPEHQAWNWNLSSDLPRIFGVFYPNAENVVISQTAGRPEYFNEGNGITLRYEPSSDTVTKGLEVAHREHSDAFGMYANGSYASKIIVRVKYKDGTIGEIAMKDIVNGKVQGDVTTRLLDGDRVNADGEPYVLVNPKSESGNNRDATVPVFSDNKDTQDIEYVEVTVVPNPAEGDFNNAEIRFGNYRSRANGTFKIEDNSVGIDFLDWITQRRQGSIIDTRVMNPNVIPSELLIGHDNDVYLGTKEEV